ncbi:MAG: DUF6724 family protein [Anaerotardibacter sp.]
MDLGAIYSFLFESMEGIGCLVGAGLVISLVVAAISERKTKKTFKDRGELSEDHSFDE